MRGYRRLYVGTTEAADLESPANVSTISEGLEPVRCGGALLDFEGCARACVCLKDVTHISSWIQL